MNRCSECRDGGHEDYDADVRLTVLVNPDGGPPKRAYLCGDHREAAASDGYVVSTKGGAK